MAKVAIARRNGRRVESQCSNSKDPVDDVVNGAERLYELMLKDCPSVDDAQTEQKQNIPRAAVEGHTPKQQSTERRRKSSSPLKTIETSKKSKIAFEDDGSRSYEDVDSTDQTTSERDGISMRTSTRQDAPTLTLDVGRKAPLAEPEDSTVTPEAEHDVVKQMRLFRCRSRTTDTDNCAEAGDDDVADRGSNPDDEDYDDVDGYPGADELRDGGSPVTAAEEPVDDKEKAIAEIALKLRQIGDNENYKIVSGEMTRSASTISLSKIAIDGIQDLISNLTYEKFQDVVNMNMGSEPGVQQVTVVFRLARAAVRRFGNRTGAAADLRRIALDYFRNNVATWVVENGGWEGIAQSLRS